MASPDHPALTRSDRIRGGEPGCRRPSTPTCARRLLVIATIVGISAGFAVSLTRQALDTADQTPQTLERLAALRDRGAITSDVSRAAKTLVMKKDK